MKFSLLIVISPGSFPRKGILSKKVRIIPIMTIAIPPNIKILPKGISP